MTQNSDIIICGGGLSGCVLALAMAQIGMSVTVIDAQNLEIKDLETFDGRSYALSLSSVRLLKNLELWDDLSQNAQPMLDIKIADGNLTTGPSHLYLHFDHTEIEEGPMGHMIEDRHLRPVLHHAIDQNNNITYLKNACVTSQTCSDSKISVTLETGDTLYAQMLIGADGRKSGTALRAGIKRKGWPYAQTALVCAVEHDKPHNGTAWQYFLPSGPLAILPLTGNRSSIVWSETKQNATTISALTDADYLSVLKPRFGDFLGDITLAGKRFSYPLNLTIAQSMTATRLALVGDAAHGVHPIAGQGLNAGLKDVAALFDVIHDAKKRGEDFATQAVLDRYKEWRSFDSATLAFATDTFNKLFSNDNSLIRLGRDLGIGFVNSIPQARRAFIREAAGLTGELPSLMR